MIIQRILNYFVGLSYTGCGCGTVCSAVASDNRGPGFESSHRQLLLNNYYKLFVEKTKINEKEAENGPFKKRLSITDFLFDCRPIVKQIFELKPCFHYTLIVSTFYKPKRLPTVPI